MSSTVACGHRPADVVYRIIPTNDQTTGPCFGELLVVIFRRIDKT